MKPTKFLWGDEVGGGGGSGPSGTNDQGVVHDDTRHLWTKPSGNPGDGAVLSAAFQQTHTFGYVMQMGAGVVKLDVDASGPSSAGVGLGLWQQVMLNPLGMQGRGAALTTLAPSNFDGVDQTALRLGPSAPNNMPYGFRVELRDFGFSMVNMTGSIEVIRTEGSAPPNTIPGNACQNVFAENLFFDGRTAMPNQFTADVVSTDGTHTTITNLVGHPHPTSDNIINGNTMEIVQGTGLGGKVTINSYAGATGQTSHNAWPVNPDATSKVVIVSEGNNNPDTGVRHSSTPWRIRGNAADQDWVNCTAIFAGGHCYQISQTDGGFEAFPRRIRFRGLRNYGTHSSGINVSGAYDFVCTDYFSYNDTWAFNGYRSGYASIRLGNGCVFLQLGTIYSDGFWRNIRLADLEHWIAVNLFSKRAGFTAMTINGKDTPNNCGQIWGFKAYNSSRFTGHTGLIGGDDTDDSPESTGVGGIAMPMLTDGTPELNGHDFQLGGFTSIDDMIYHGLGKIATVAGQYEFKIFDRSRVGQDWNGGRQRLWWTGGGAPATLTKATRNTAKCSNIYTDAHIQKATMLGRCAEIYDFKYFSAGDVELPAGDPGIAYSISYCRFDAPCPVTIGNINDPTTGEKYRHRQCYLDAMYFCPAAGTINTTAGVQAFTGVGTGFDIESGAALNAGNSRVQLYTAEPDITGSFTNKFSTTNASPTINVNHVAHGRSVGDLVVFTSLTNVGGILISGGYKIASIVDADNYTVTHRQSATLTQANGGGLTTFIVIKNHRWLGEMITAPNGTSGTFSATGARLTYNGPYCFSVEQKVLRAFECFNGPTGLNINIGTWKIAGYSRNPMNLWPTNCDKREWPRVTADIPSIDIFDATGLLIMFDVPKELLDWRSSVFAYVDVQFGESFVGNATDFLKAQMVKVRSGVETTLSPVLNLTDVSKNAGDIVSFAIGNNGPFDCTVAANYVRTGSLQHDEVPDGIYMRIFAQGDGGYMPMSKASVGHATRWMVGA